MYNEMMKEEAIFEKKNGQIEAAATGSDGSKGELAAAARQGQASASDR